MSSEQEPTARKPAAESDSANEGHSSGSEVLDQWELYPCQIDGKMAWVSFHFGIREVINERLPKQVVRVRVQARFADADGHPHPNEFDDLERVEKEINRRLSDFKGTLVGRITVDGARHLFYYVEIPEEMLSDLLSSVSRSSGYAIDFLVDFDPEKEQYWTELFPGFEDWQAIRDRKAVTDLMRGGIDLSEPRELIHLASFPSQPSAEEMGVWLTSEGFEVQGIFKHSDDELPFRVVFKHTIPPQLLNLIEFTVPILRRSHALGGNYQGWQTTIDSADDEPGNSQGNEA